MWSLCDKKVAKKDQVRFFPAYKGWFSYIFIIVKIITAARAPIPIYSSHIEVSPDKSLLVLLQLELSPLNLMNAQRKRMLIAVSSDHVHQ